MRVPIQAQKHPAAVAANLRGLGYDRYRAFAGKAGGDPAHLRQVRGAERARLRLCCGEATAGSDIDLLVEFEPGRSLLDQAELEALLGCRMDVVSEKGLYLLRRRIPPYEQGPAGLPGPYSRAHREDQALHGRRGGNAFSLTVVYAKAA